MKKILLLLISLITLSFLYSSTLASQVIIKYNSVEVWSTPTSVSLSDIMGYVGSGEVYNVLDKYIDKQNGSKYEIKTIDGQIGWIAGNFISIRPMETSRLQKTIKKVTVGVSVESIPYCNQVRIIKLDIFNNYQTVQLKIDPITISLKDSDKTLLRGLPQKAIEQILDGIVNKFDTQANEDEKMIKYIEAQLGQAQADQQVKALQQAQTLARQQAENQSQGANYVATNYGDFTVIEQEPQYNHVQNPLFSDIFSSQSDNQTANLQVWAAYFTMKQKDDLDKKQAMLSYESTLSSDYLNEPEYIPPQSRMKIKYAFSVIDAKPPYKLSIIINKNIFNFDIEQ